MTSTVPGTLALPTGTGVNTPESVSAAVNAQLVQRLAVSANLSDVESASAALENLGGIGEIAGIGGPTITTAQLATALAGANLSVDGTTGKLDASGGGGGAVSSVVGETGAVTSAQIATALAGSGLTVVNGQLVASGGGSEAAPGLTVGSIVQPTFIKTDGLTLTAPHTSTSVPAFAPVVAEPASQIVVDAASVVGNWLGVGAALTPAAAYVLYTYMTQSQRTAILTEAFGTYNWSFLRIAMGSPDYTPFAFTSYADNLVNGTPTADPNLTTFSIAQDEDYVIPLLLEILAINPQIKILAEPWSPPPWMKSTNSMVGGAMAVNSTNLATLAQYFLMHYRAYQAYGITISYYGPQNEPNNSTGYPSCTWAAADLVTFVGSYLGPAFDAAGITDVKFLTPCVSWGNVANYSGTQLASNTSNQYIAALAAHGYSGSPLSPYEIARLDGGGTASKPVWLTEWQQNPKSNGAATDLVNMAGTQAITCLRYGTEAVIYWNLCLDLDGGPESGQIIYTAGNDPGGSGLFNVPNTGGGAVTRTAAYYVFAALSQYMKPGCKRVRSNCFAGGYGVGFTDIANVAFANPDGSRFVYLFNPNTVARTVTITDALTRESTIVTLNANDFGVVTWGPGTTVSAGTYTAPSAPQSLTATGATGVVNLAWTAPATSGSDAGPNGYVIFRGTTAGGEATTGLPLVVLPSGTLAYADTTGTEGTTYYYVVQAFGIGGYSASSNEAHSAPSAPAATAPPQPSLSVSPGVGENVITIGVSTNNGSAMVSYALRRGTTSGGETALTTIDSTALSVTYTDSAVTNGTEYFYTATATNGVGTSSASAEENGTPEASVTAPAHGLVATGTAGGMATPASSANQVSSSSSVIDQRVYVNLTTNTPTATSGELVVIGGNYPSPSGGSKTTSTCNLSIVPSTGALGCELYTSDQNYYNWFSTDADTGTTAGVDNGAVTGTPATLSSVAPAGTPVWLRIVANLGAAAWVDADGLSHPAKCVQGWYSPTGTAGSWTQFGSTRAYIGSATAFHTDATGVQWQCMAQTLVGSLYKWQVQNADFSYAINVDLTGQATGTTTYTDGVGSVFTVTSPSSIS